MTSLGVERSTADAIREVADQYGVKIPRALAALEAAWRMLNNEQKRDAMFQVAGAAVPPNGSKSAQSANTSVQTDRSPAQQQGSDTQDRDAGPLHPPAGDQDTAAKRPQRPLRSHQNGGADLAAKRAPAA